MPDRDPVDQPRVILPKNLSEALKRLQDIELDRLLREVIAEVERRGVPKPVDTVAPLPTVPGTKSRSRRTDTRGTPADLPAGKVNLIKASHAAGMKPPAQLSYKLGCLCNQLHGGPGQKPRSAALRDRWKTDGATPVRAACAID
jgi:hypothetical protein